MPERASKWRSRLVRRARELNNFVRIDMEDSSCTTDTLRIYRELRREYSNVGVVIQAYLRRTMDDVAASKICGRTTACAKAFTSSRAKSPITTCA